MRFERIEGRSGWQAPAGVPLLSSVLDSLRGEEGEEGSQSQGENKPPEGRETVVAFSPGFSAVPCAFARALPTSSVIGVGVNDPEVGEKTAAGYVIVSLHGRLVGTWVGPCTQFVTRQKQQQQC